MRKLIVAGMLVAGVFFGTGPAYAHMTPHYPACKGKQVGTVFQTPNGHYHWHCRANR